jgi:8-oxo-dGTP pyrophosphatase MutT (NUDIX family)
MTERTVVGHIDRLDLRFAQKPWAFAAQRRDEIAAYFVDLQRRKPVVWNGRVLVLYDMHIGGGELRGAFLETDFAPYRAWKHWGYPAAGVWDCFAAAAIVGADGGWLLGVMGPHTANAGRIYFPCGTPDPSDRSNNRVDLEFSVWRELTEETGLRRANVEPESGWTMVHDGAVVALFKVMQSNETAAVLRQRILKTLNSQQQPELADIRIVHRPADLDPAMPHFVTTFLMYRWQAEPLPSVT